MLIVFLSLILVVFALVSMWKENRFGWPPQRHDLVHGRHHSLLRRYCPSRGIRSDGQIVEESLAPCGSRDIRVGMNHCPLLASSPDVFPSCHAELTDRS